MCICCSVYDISVNILTGISVFLDPTGIDHALDLVVLVVEADALLIVKKSVDV